MQIYQASSKHSVILAPDSVHVNTDATARQLAEPRSKQLCNTAASINDCMDTKPTKQYS